VIIYLILGLATFATLLALTHAVDRLGSSPR
jgi:hypothetical protein